MNHDETPVLRAEAREAQHQANVTAALDAAGRYMEDRIDWLMLAHECLAQAADTRGWRVAYSRIAADLERRIEEEREME